ncbi:uncharacterized protein V6R79_002767 [Siganus canaliculatus]
MEPTAEPRHAWQEARPVQTERWQRRRRRSEEDERDDAAQSLSVTAFHFTPGTETFSVFSVQDRDWKRPGIPGAAPPGGLEA